MRTQRPHARFAMLSTASSLTDPFWSVWSSKDPSWTRIEATLNAAPGLIAPDVIARAKSQLSENDFKREYLGIPAGNQVSPFTLKLYERATQSQIHPSTWDLCRPHIIAHDVGQSKDRSTAVVGGISVLEPGLVGLAEFNELAHSSGYARADALAQFDGNCNAKALIIVDLSFDPSYADILFDRFGNRVIGLRITSHGDTIDNFETRQLRNGRILVYKISRTYLLDFLLRELQHDTVRIVASDQSMRAYEQLMQLDVEYKQNGIIYTCPAGYHDDLAISMRHVGVGGQTSAFGSLVLAAAATAADAHTTGAVCRRVDLSIIQLPAQVGSTSDAASTEPVCSDFLKKFRSLSLSRFASPITGTVSAPSPSLVSGLSMSSIRLLRKACE